VLVILFEKRIGFKMIYKDRYLNNTYVSREWIQRKEETPYQVLKQLRHEDNNGVFGTKGICTIGRKEHEENIFKVANVKFRRIVCVTVKQWSKRASWYILRRCDIPDTLLKKFSMFGVVTACSVLKSGLGLG
jgi:hypothetical protein